MTRTRIGLRIVLALTASLGVHFAAAMVMTPAEQNIQIEGGVTTEIAAIGASFEDLLEGTFSPQPAAATPSAPVKPAVVEAAAVHPVPDAPAEAVPAASRASSGEPVFPPVSPENALAPLSIQPVAATSASMPLRSSEAPLVLPTRRANAAPPVQVPMQISAESAETVSASPVDDEIPVPVARPPRRDEERRLTEAAQKTKPVAKKQVSQSLRGNASRNSRAGQAAGREQSKTKRGGTSTDGQARKAGNAQASNYPGKVYSRIRRTRQGQAGGRGVARVRFSIAGNGALASIQLAASSGSASVDRIAIDHIRRSAPFPPPPPGAQRNYVIPVEVRR